MMINDHTRSILIATAMIIVHNDTFHKISCQNMLFMKLWLWTLDWRRQTACPHSTHSKIRDFFPIKGHVEQGLYLNRDYIWKFHNANAGMSPPPLSLSQAKPAIKIPTKIYHHLEIPKSWRVQLQLWSTELSLNNLAQQAPQTFLLWEICLWNM